MRSWKQKASTGLAITLLTASLLPAPARTFAAETDNVSIATTTTYAAVAPSSTAALSSTLLSALSSASVQNDTYAITTARTAPIGSAVTVQGVVTYREDTGNNYSNLYIQDGQAGIVIRGQSLTAQPGDTIQVSGKLGAYQKLLQINATSSNVQTITSGTIPQPQTIDSSGFAAGNPNEALLVKLSQVQVDHVSGNRYTLSDANGTFVVYTTHAWLQAGTTYTSITGVITRYQDTYQLIPRSAGDIEGGKEASPSSPQPLRLTINQIQGTAQTSTYAEQQVQSVEGIVTMVKSRSSFYMQMPDTLADQDERTSEGILVYRAAHGVKIGDRITVDGSVKEYKEAGYADAADLTTTEIVASSINVLASNQPLPAPIIIGAGGRTIPSQIAAPDGKAAFDPTKYSIDFYESLEGMRVQLNHPDIIGPYTYEIPVTVAAERHARRTPAGGLIITDGDFNSDRLLIAGKPAQPIKTGDRFAGAINGIMSYSYSNFKILPEQPLPAIQDGGWKREVSSLQNGTQQLTIASFNVENFWNDPAATSKTQQIARDVVDHLHTPDILALMEVQDNNGATDDGTTDASQNFAALIGAIRDAGGAQYRYASIAPVNNQDGGAPGGNIRVGFLYNPQRVTLPNAPGGAGDSVTAVTYGQSGLTYNPGRIDPGNIAFQHSRKSLAAEFVFQGQSVIVIANHFNSKGGDQALYGAAQPPVRSSEIQRARQAAVLNGFVKDTLARNSNANIVLVGDFNDFQFSNTFNILKGNQLTNLVDTLPVNERYSYVYEGNSQTLDHVLMTPQLAERAQLDIVHINADFMEQEGRVSDHDPLLARIDFTPKSNSKDKDKNRNSSVTPVTDTTTGTGQGGGGGVTTPGTPVTGGLEPIAQGASADGRIVRWTLTPQLAQQGTRTIATAIIDIAAAQRMLPNTATTLQFNLPAANHADGFNVQIGQAAGTLLTGQNQLQRITITTPLGQYHLPVALLRQAATSGQTLELNISSDTAALAQAQADGYAPYAVVAYNVNTIAPDGVKTTVHKLGQYVARTIQSASIRPGQRLAVMRMEQDAAGNVNYVPVPFSIQNDNVILLSNTNSSYIVSAAAKPNFADMQGHWAQPVVHQLRDRGIVHGQTEARFAPATAITRAEFAALLTRTLGLSGQTSTSLATSFPDVNNSAWYANAVQTAAYAGWIKGDERGNFRPSAKVTRQEMAVMLERAFSDLNANRSDTVANERTSAAAQRLSDLSTIATWAQPAVNRLHSAGLIEGNAAGRFQPAQLLTRAESAVVMSRLMEGITSTTNE
ncbi:S-layer homology domain-containing protein [Paenibacillus sp. SGZ-1009]|uniref:S-layer homology domain-containing protein n=1 Tax=Paenibacillus campi TaxID=3106031 RepID=UPI002AFEB29F|nr:S-layer homology domain-containing protein [Paenibacillus sp. SGZ-1009]